MLNVQDIKKVYIDAFEKSATLPGYLEAFASWITRGEICTMQKATAEALEAQGVGRRPDHAAALGYAIHCGVLDVTAVSLFSTDVQQLSGRKFFAAGKTPGFEADGVVLLGLALGLSTLAKGGPAPEWFSKLLAEAHKRLGQTPWHVGLVNISRGLFGARIDPVETPIDLKIASASRMAAPIAAEDLEAAWTLVTGLTHEDGPSRDAARVAVVNTALSRLSTLSASGLTPESLAEVLKGVQRSMRLWTWEASSRTGKAEARQWHIDHEYHVQNLLWAILSPLIPDLEEELNLPALGQKTPRADLGVPSLRTIIEAKFIRDRGRAAFRKIIDEIGSDASLYLTANSPYDHLIPFIWDDHAQTEEHAELLSGLRQIKGVVDAIIIPRPGKMRT
jgi:hypothetical protein